MTTIDLRKPNLREVKIGTEVITSKGFTFTLVKRNKAGKESWKDETSGLVWHDVEKEKYTYKNALEEFGTKLPTKEDFKLAEKHGFREVLPNTDIWFWSSSPYPTDSDFAYLFNGGNGYTDYYYRSNALSVRCVGR
jgi:hypothetical protein